MTQARRNINRALLIAAHRQHVKEGKYEAARRILFLLRKRSIPLGCDDTDWYLEHLFDKLGLNCNYGRYYTATYYI